VVVGQVVHPQPGYPFSLELTIEYKLSAGGLTVRTTATNVGETTCPYGAGAHPYLTVGTETVDDMLLQVPARTVFRSDDRGIPDGSVPVGETDVDFRVARRVGDTKLDHGFTDLERDDTGRASVELRPARAA
jgi:galactose mutarotase-like enzyme